MNKIFLILIVIGLNTWSVAQIPVQSPKGIYKSLSEFLKELPSEKLTFEKKVKVLDDAVDINIVGAQLDVSRKDCKKIGNIFGFSTGIHSYILLDKNFRPKSVFTKLYSNGHLLIYEKIVKVYKVGLIEMESVSTADSEVSLEVIDSKSYEKYSFSLFQLEELFEKSSKIKSDFEADELKNTNLLSYFIKFINESPKEHWILAKEKGEKMGKISE